MSVFKTLCTGAFVLLLAGCSDGLLHRADQQQGNLVTDRMIEQLKPGMDRNQVLFIMGQPVLKNSFDSERWDYVYTYAPRSRNPEIRQLTLYFQNGSLNRIIGNYKELNPLNLDDS